MRSGNARIDADLGADIGEDVCGHRKDNHQQGSRPVQAAGGIVCTLPHGPVQFQRKEIGAVQQKDSYHRQSADQPVRIQQREQVAGEHHVLVYRQAARQVGKSRSEQERGHE